MLVLDYIIIAVALVSFVLGLVKGFLNPIVNLAGFFVVLYAGGSFSSILFPLIAKVIPNENTLFASIREKYGEAFNQSWIVQNVFKTNPIGEGLVNSAFKKLIELLEEALIPTV